MVDVGEFSFNASRAKKVVGQKLVGQRWYDAESAFRQSAAASWLSNLKFHCTGQYELRSFRYHII